ncbi:hypothetical protein CEXT_330681, partial [Caerostris extrusa]
MQLRILVSSTCECTRTIKEEYSPAGSTRFKKPFSVAYHLQASPCFECLVST